MVGQLPVKKKKTKQRNRFFYYYLIQQGDFIYLDKRLNNDIWKNLYQFPLIETTKKLSESEIIDLTDISFLNGCSKNLKNVSSEKKHILSHQVIFARLIHIEIDNNCNLKNQFRKINRKNLDDFAVPRLVEKLMEETKIF